MSNILLSKYSKAVDKAIRRAQDRSGWVDYYQAGKLEENLWEILGELSDECLPFDPETAFYASLYLYKRLGETELDDSGGTISALTDECEQVWHL